MTGTFCVAFVNSGGDRSYVVEYAVNAADTWEQKTISVTASPTAGTWNYTTGIGMSVIFTQSCGSTFQTTANAWQTGLFYGTSNQVNNTGATSDTFLISQVQLTLGTATAFRGNTYEFDLNKCQRYAYYIAGYPIGTCANSNTTYSLGATGFPTTMRTTPAIATSPAATFSVNAGAAGTVQITQASVAGCGIINSAANWTTGAIASVTMLLDARI